MPITIRPPASDLKKVLTASEELVQPTQKNLKEIRAAPDLSAAESDALRVAGEVLQHVRVRREFPILGRVFDDLMSRLKDGAAMKPLSEGETRALIDLTGSLSYAENDALVMLKNRGIITSAHWDSVVEPHAKATNLDQERNKGKLKWGLATVGNMASPLGVAVAVSTVASGGIVGMGAATVVALGIGMGITPKIQGRIQTAGRVEGRTLGMDALEGKEVESEAVLLASRMAEGRVFNGATKDIRARLSTEVEVGTLALNAREKAGIAWTDEEQPFMPLATEWYYGLADLLAADEKKPLSDASLRQAAFDLRGKVMKPAQLETVAKGFIMTALAARKSDDPARQALVFMEHVSDMSEKLASELEKTKGVPNAEVKAVADGLVKLSGVVNKEARRTMPGLLLERLTDIAAGKPQDMVAMNRLQEGVKQARNSREDLRSLHGLTAYSAEDTVKAAFSTLWGQVLPSFQEVEDTPKLRIQSTVSDGRGGFTVSGAVKHGWFGTEGSFSMKLTAAGLVDPKSMKIDLGPTFLVNAAKNAVERGAAMLGKDVRVDLADLKREGKAPDTPYVVNCTLDNGKSFDVSVTPMGMVDWSTVRV
jgi:hypothetical protein